MHHDDGEPGLVRREGDIVGRIVQRPKEQPHIDSHPRSAQSAVAGELGVDAVVAKVANGALARGPATDQHRSALVGKHLPAGQDPPREGRQCERVRVVVLRGVDDHDRLGPG